MGTDYCIIVASTTTMALIWRTLLLDHEHFLMFIKRIPVVGSALSCGFCTAVWLSLAATALHNPIASALTRLPFLAVLLLGWFTVSAGVLFLRNLIAALMEGAGVLTGLHRKMH